MAIKTRAQLKAYFEENDIPIEEEFIDLLDSLWHKSETIPIEKVVIGEQELTCAATTVWDFAEGNNAILTIDQNTTLEIQNMEVGNLGVLVIQQDSTGGWTLALPAGHKVGYNGAGVVDLSADPDTIDTLTVYRSSVGYLWLHNKHFTNA